MQGIRPEGLSDEELERYAFLQAGALPQEWAERLSKLFAQNMAAPKPQEPDPRQLNLFDPQ